MTIRRGRMYNITVNGSDRTGIALEDENSAIPTIPFAILKFPQSFDNTSPPSYGVTVLKVVRHIHKNDVGSETG